jgi:hypothetical protein
MSDPEEITAQSAWIGRAVGVLQVLGGSLEEAGSVGLLLVPEPTFLSKAGGTILLAHSADTVAAGLLSIWYGSVRQTLTQQAGAAAARQVGASNGTAELVATRNPERWKLGRPTPPLEPSLPAVHDSLR